MIDKIREIFGREYHPLNRITINKKVLEKNYKILAKVNPKIKIAPVVKSNAYGHGTKIIAKVLDELSPVFICVDSLYEAYELLNAGIKSPILIMGYIDPNNLKIKKLPFSYAVYDSSQLEALNKYQKGSQVHLKIDTGMHRLGIPIDDLPRFVEKALTFKNLQITGLMSHLASSNNSSPQTKLQITNFRKAAKILKEKNIYPQWKHVAASEGLINLKEIGDISNMARVGIALYGAGNFPEDIKPILKLTSKIVQIKKLKKGESVGYSSTFRAHRDIMLGVLPIGYNDGVDRRLSNAGYVKVYDKFCQIVGRVSMNITTIDLTGVNKPTVGDEVVIFSDDANDINSLQSLSEVCNTIPHDLLVHLHATAIRRELV